MRRARKHIAARPELEPGYRSFVKAFLIWGNLPWIVMGIGCVFGGIPSVFAYFRPRGGNPYVIAFYASVVLFWLLSTNWIVFRGGAEMLATHPGILNLNFKNPRTVMVLWFLCLGAGILGVVFACFRDLPFPQIPQ
jgi:hypothetical protein